MNNRMYALCALVLVTACSSRSRPPQTSTQPGADAAAPAAAPTEGPVARGNEGQGNSGEAIAAARARDAERGERGRSAQAPGQQRRIRADRNTITREEIDQYAAGAINLYEFVVNRHNDWLRSTGGSRLENAPNRVSAEQALRAVGVTVYVDGVRFGANPESLRNIPLSNVALARRLSPSEAQGKYGLDNDAGTIEVFTALDRVR